MAIILKDTFTRANTTASTTGLGNLEIGGVGWITIRGAVGNISSNKGVITNSDGAFVANAGISNATVKATFSDANNSQLIFRCASDVQYMFLECTGIQWNMYIYDGGWTQIASINRNFVVGDIAEVTCNGSSIIAKINGTQIINIVNTFNQNATYFGLGTGNGTSTFDDFQVDSIATGGTTNDGAVSLSADSSLTVGANVLVNGASTLSANADLTTNGAILLSGATTLSADTILNANGSIILSGATIFTADAQLTVSAEVLTTDVGFNLSATSDLNTNASVIVSGASALSADTTLNVIPNVLVSGVSSMATDSQLTVNAEVIAVDTSIALSATSNLNVNASVLVNGQANFVGSSTITVNGSLISKYENIIETTFKISRKIETDFNINRELQTKFEVSRKIETVFQI